MIPDFPEEKARLWTFWNAYLRKRVEHYSGFVNTLTSFTHHEGDRFSYDQAEGKTQESEYEPIQGEFKMHLSEARDLTQEKVADIIDGVAKNIGDQLSKSLFSTLNKATTESGRSLDKKGEPLTPDDFLEMMEKIEPTFTEAGEFQPPFIIMHPDVFDAYKNKFKEWDNDPEVKKKHDEMIERQRERWNARQASRKLVD